jgi:hypothetical protein
MGGLFSKGSTPDNTDDMMNYLLKGIFSNIDLLDMYAMTDSKKCQEYIIFGQKALEQIFVKMNIFPMRDQKGFIYFRKMTTLQRELLKSDEHLANCKEIATFFATILRIFGAVYFTLKWTDIPLQKVSGELQAPTGQLFQKRSLLQRMGNLLSSKGQEGGGWMKLNQLLHRWPSAEPNAMLANFITDKFVFDDDNLSSGVIILKAVDSAAMITIVQTDSIFCQKRPTRRPVVGFRNAAPSSPTSAVVVPPTPAPAGQVRMAAAQAAAAAAATGNPPRPPPPLTGLSPAAPAAAPVAAPAAAPDAAPPVALKDIIAGYTPATVKEYFIDLRVENTFVILNYTFGGRENYSISFSLKSEQCQTLRNSRNTTCFKLENFRWGQRSPPQRKDFGNKSLTFTMDTAAYNSGQYISQTDSGTAINLVEHIFTDLSKLIGEYYINPNILTSNYLVYWRYINPNASEKVTYLQNTNPRNLLFVENTRNSDFATIIYKKDNVKVPNRRDPISILIYCDVSISRKDPDNPADQKWYYLVSIENMYADPNSRTDYQGIFIPISGPIRYEFRATTGMEPPISVKHDWDIPKFIRRCVEQQIRKDISVGDVAYRRATGTGQYYTLPIVDPSHPFDLGKLQRIMRPDISPFPACTALAAELLQKLEGDRFSTAVCNPKFRARQNGSLPKVGKDITTSKSIHAFSALFLDTTHDSLPKVVETEEWKEFEKSMKEVSADTLLKRCKTDKSVQISGSLAGQIEGVVNNLLAYQDEYKNRAYDILWDIFDQNSAIQRKGFLLNESLYSGGMEYLLTVKNKCISLLREYYYNCDKIYYEGVKLFIENQGKPKEIQTQNAIVNPNKNEENDDELEENTEDNNKEKNVSGESGPPRVIKVGNIT